MRRLALAGFLLLGSVFTPLAAQAQDCEIDLTDSIIALTQAQADATSGDTAAALSTITGVQAQLENIRRSCPLTAAETTFDLTETFTTPDDLFSFSYPAGWFEAEYYKGRDFETMFATVNPDDVPLPTGGTVSVSSAAIASNYSPYVALPGQQSVSVVVGTPLQLFMELGLYSEDLAESLIAGEMDFTAVAVEMEARINGSELAPELVVTSIDADRPTVAFEARSDATDITLVLVALDEENNWYAMLATPVIPEDNVDMLALLLAMAETVE